MADTAGEGKKPESDKAWLEWAATVKPYRRRPAEYCKHCLGVDLTPSQKEIARRLVKPPYKVLVRAGHNVGKFKRK